MNVFLDSNILFSDPFFKGNFERNFLTTLKNINGKLYLSDVVYKETINNYRREVKKRRKKYSSAYGHLIKILSSVPAYTLQDDEIHVQELITFYDELQELGLLVIVEHNQFDIFSKIVNRAIDNKKPFADGKEEFKDTVIWLSYAHFVEDKSLSDCFFITNNSSEFFNSTKTELHPDLLEDTSSIKGYLSIEAFMTAESELISEANEEAYFEKILDLGGSEKVRSMSYIGDLVREYFTETINQEVSEYIESLSAANKDKLFPNYAEVQSGPIYQLKMWDHEREIYRDEIVIYGVVQVMHDVSMQINEMMSLGSKSLVHKIDFTFSLSADEFPSNFEVKEIITQELNPDEF
ncbi:PIN domain-containing protein [Brevibacillus reuszeri]|uniref:PIN domain-containing protein n=1 Tax=Brevibacillus reuszeri TaxID=54915 RepID=UPI003D1C87D1